MNDQMTRLEPERDPDDPVDVEVEEEVTRIVPEGFQVHDGESAAWVVRRIIAARDYAQKVKAWAELEGRRAEREEKHLFYLFGRQLRAWTESEVARLKGRRKSIALPSGTLGFRDAPARLVIRDEALTMSWARSSCPTAIVVTERLLKTPITEHFTQTGEVPPGVEVSAAETIFYIR